MLAMSAKHEFRFLERLRVRWAEVDVQRIVFNGHYFMYFDTAIAGYWRALALPYEQTLAGFGGELYVKKASLEYHASARYDDLIDVGVRCARIGNSSIVFDAAVLLGEQPLVSGKLVYVFADANTQTSRTVPQALREVLLAYEAGEPMLELHLGTWAEFGLEARALRAEVLGDEQHIAAALDADDSDLDALHAVARNRLGQAIATGRLIAAEPGASRIGRVAVRRPIRGAGVGRAVLDTLLGAAQARGDREVQLNAEGSAVAFYRKLGFDDRGQPFTRNGLVHLEMVRRL
jgi:YbgC/YbaW family acyl-CoA thioester hydrolase